MTSTTANRTQSAFRLGAREGGERRTLDQRGESEKRREGESEKARWWNEGKKRCAIFKVLTTGLNFSPSLRPIGIVALSRALGLDSSRARPSALTTKAIPWTGCEKSIASKSLRLQGYDAPVKRSVAVYLLQNKSQHEQPFPASFCATDSSSLSFLAPPPSTPQLARPPDVPIRRLAEPK